MIQMVTSPVKSPLKMDGQNILPRIVTVPTSLTGSPMVGLNQTFTITNSRSQFILCCKSFVRLFTWSVDTLHCQGPRCTMKLACSKKLVRKSAALLDFPQIKQYFIKHFLVWNKDWNNNSCEYFLPRYIILLKFFILKPSTLSASAHSLSSLQLLFFLTESIFQLVGTPQRVLQASQVVSSPRGAQIIATPVSGFESPQAWSARKRPHDLIDLDYSDGWVEPKTRAMFF